MDRKEYRTRFLKEVSAILREERIKRGLSMTVLAERAGLSQQIVSYVERGLRNSKLETLVRIADGMEIDIANVIRKAQQRAEKK